MFKKLSLQGAESDTGFRVQIVGRGQLEYAVGKRRLLVRFEPGVSPKGLPDIAVYVSEVEAWEPPHEEEGIGADARSSIARDIGDALDFLGVKHQIE